jgi:hypothetical protein
MGEKRITLPLRSGLDGIRAEPVIGSPDAHGRACCAIAYFRAGGGFDDAKARNAWNIAIHI